MNYLLTFTNLTAQEFITLAIIVFVAGIVRGFSGFALSGLVMATAVIILPPIALIPMLWWMEMTASLLMMKGGFKDADKPTAYGLVIGSSLGWPIGLALTKALPIETSKIIALAIIVTLALTQLAKIRLAFLATKPGLYGAGLLAGIVSGLSNVGAMVVALYVLAADAPARSMRGSLIVFLFLSSLVSFFIQLAFGVMDLSGITRGLVFAAPTALGVMIGLRLFVPRFEPYYRPVCLTLLISLAGVSLIRTVLT